MSMLTYVDVQCGRRSKVTTSTLPDTFVITWPSKEQEQAHHPGQQQWQSEASSATFEAPSPWWQWRQWWRTHR